MINHESNYKDVLQSGMFWEWYPELTGEWAKDKDEWIQHHSRKFEVPDYMQYGESGPMEFSHTPTPTPPCIGHAQASEELDELEYISNTLGYVEEEGLVAEVVYFALKEMKADPTLSPSEALQFGYSEWIK